LQQVFGGDEVKGQRVSQAESAARRCSRVCC
jgi:hypothetical protein